MDEQKLKTILVADFNIDVLGGYIRNDRSLLSVDATSAPFGQVIPVLVDHNLECWNERYDFAVVWTQPQNIIQSFQDALEFQSVSIDDILQEVDQYCQALLKLENQVKSVFVPTWVLPEYLRGYGMLDQKMGLGIADMLARMNLRLAESLNNAQNFYVLNSQKWFERIGSKAFSSKLWYMGKIPFDNQVFKEASKDILSAINGVMGNARKLVIVDLDDVLWGGIVGDVGWENIKLGGHDPYGESFVDFQKGLKALTRRGILLGIASKNEESVALEAINNHAEMVLKQDDFAGWKINWNDKAQNIADLVSELNLGLQSVVFIDDNPVERARVREALPEVFVPEWPEDKLLYKKALLSLSCFDSPLLSEEDQKRSQMYTTERKRKTLKNKVGSAEDWLKTLEVNVKVESLNQANQQRTVQLLNKTNQMNLLTRRMTEPELVDWVNEDGHKLWTFRVSDKFGDSGLTGIASLEVKDKVGMIVDFVLSCRVFGRKVEHVMLHTLIQHAVSLQLDEVRAQYIPTPKNKPCLQFFQGSGLDNVEEHCFVWKTDKPYNSPEGIVQIVDSD